MTFSKFKPTKILLLVAVMSLLLGTLATLQYRWLGQVSAGERQRMQASLDTGVARFSQDFNREITRAYLSFQMDAATLRQDKPGELGKRFKEWDAKVPYPRLVSDLYLLDKDEADRPRLNHFDRAQEKFVQVEWPAEFSELRPRLEHTFVKNIRQPELLKELSLNPVEAAIPALVAPVLVTPQVTITANRDVRVERKQMPPGIAEPSPFAGYLIIKLDRSVLTGELIPTLARRYFSGSSGLEYNIAVINPQNSNELIYHSDTNSPKQQPITGDASASLMDIQPDQLDALWFGLPRRPAGPDGNGAEFTHSLAPDRVVMRSDNESQNGITNSRSVTVRVFNRSIQANATGDKTAVGGPWQLLIKHRAGSLEAAVTSARRRNLAISFGVLLLLAGSVAMIVISTRRAERLANKQMDFVSGVSHEFRTPLSVICSAGENLADGIIDEPGKTAKYGELIRDEGRRLTEMVEQVLEFAGARSGRQLFRIVPVDVESIINEALATYQPLIDEKDYVIEQSIEKGLPLIAADAAALRRTLQNLLSNAIKYEKDNRWIGIRARSSNNGQAKEIEVTIEDRGIGIAPDEVSHIFEPFYRAREVTAAQIHGNGLGLSLVKHVIEAHRGRVSVVSVVGEGSAFTLHLPIMNYASNANTNDAVYKS